VCDVVDYVCVCARLIHVFCRRSVAACVLLHSPTRCRATMQRACRSRCLSTASVRSVLASRCRSHARVRVAVSQWTTAAGSRCTVPQCGGGLVNQVRVWRCAHVVGVFVCEIVHTGTRRRALSPRYRPPPACNAQLCFRQCVCVQCHTVQSRARAHRSIAISCRARRCSTRRRCSRRCLRATLLRTGACACARVTASMCAVTSLNVFAIDPTTNTVCAQLGVGLGARDRVRCRHRHQPTRAHLGHERQVTCLLVCALCIRMWTCVLTRHTCHAV
jgi:hypothetical protein